MLKVLSLFSGIGAFEKALERLNIDYELVGFSEIDKYAIRSYCAIHGVDESLNLGDVSKIDTSKLSKDIDLLTHGSPCQDFSLAGKQAGGDKDSGTRSSLMYETIRIIGDIKPKYIIWENVKNLLSKKHIHNFNNYLKALDDLGYNSYYQVLNSKDYGIPQNRERVFTVSIRKDIDPYDLFQPFPFPEKQELKLRLKDILEDNVDEKYYLSEKMIKYISASGTANFKNADCKINLDIARPLTVEHGKRAGTTNYLSDELPDNYDLSQSEVNNFGGGIDEECLHIKNATKRGYIEAYDGDGCYITNIDKKRGTVQKEMIPTLKTSPDIGVVIKDE